MKANELMIGDYLRINRDRICIKKDTIVKVRQIDANRKFKNHIGCATCRPLDDMQYEGGIWCDYLDPIPLTAEILEKNCDECLPGINLMYKLKGPYMMSCEKENLWVFGLTDGCGRYPLVKISYVHELQHALKLCGIDKEIRL